MRFILLKSDKDTDLEHIKSVFDEPSVARFVCIDNENFWSYVTETENVYFYKVHLEDNLVGTAQCELCEGVLYLALVVFPEYQNKGIGTAIVKSIINGITDLKFSKIQVSIDEKNSVSIRLFKRVGFVQIGQDDELIDFEYNM